MLRVLLLLTLMLVPTSATAGIFNRAKKVQCPQCCNTIKCEYDKCDAEYMCECKCCKVCWIIPKCVPCKVAPPCCEKPTPAPPIEKPPAPKPVQVEVQPAPVLQPACVGGQCNVNQQRGLININRNSNRSGLFSRFRR